MQGNDEDDEDGVLATLRADDSSEEESDFEDEAALAPAPKVHKPLPTSLLIYTVPVHA